MEEETHNKDRIEISVQISETTTYDIMIPRRINPNNYPGVMKRLKAIYGMIPKYKLDEGTPQTNIVLKLGLEESEDVLKIYSSSTPETFLEFLMEKYGFTETPRSNIVSLMGRLRKRVYKMKEKSK